VLGLRPNGAGQPRQISATCPRADGHDQPVNRLASACVRTSAPAPASSSPAPRSPRSHRASPPGPTPSLGTPDPGVQRHFSGRALRVNLTAVTLTSLARVISVVGPALDVVRLRRCAACRELLLLLQC